MSDLLSAISVLLVFIIMFNENLNSILSRIAENKPNKEKQTEYRNFIKTLENLRLKILYLSAFEFVVIGTILYSIVIFYEKISPVFIISVLILFSVILIFVTSCGKVIEIGKKINK